MDFISEIMKLEPKFCVRAFLASRVSPSLSSSTTELTPSPPGTSSSDILEYSDRSSYNRTFADRKCHVTSMGKETKARSIIRLSLLPKPIRNVQMVKLANIPEEAAAGLAGVISDSKMNPKQLQHEADKLSNKLIGRKFPANSEIVRSARHRIMKEMYQNDIVFDGDYKDFKKKALLEKAIQQKIEKDLKGLGFGWKPLFFKKPDDGVIFALSRFGSHFAEMKRILGEFNRNGFVPATVLDYGCGIGSAFWAAFERWGDQVKEYSLMDTDDRIRHLSMDIIRGSNYKGAGEFITKNVFFRRDLFPSNAKKYDLVILHRTLSELPSHEARIDLIERLWKRTNRYLVIAEASSVEAFKAVMAVRDHIIVEGTDFDLEAVKEQLDNRNLLDDEIIEILADSRLKSSEKYFIAKSKLPPGVKIPTKISPGFVFAPCPHDGGCPKLTAQFDKIETCKFSVRWKEFRADHKTHSQDGTLTGNYCYLIMEKGHRPAGAIHARVLEQKKAVRCVSCKICTPFHGIQHFVVGKRAGPIYKQVRGTKTSQLFPFDMKFVASELPLLEPNNDDDRNSSE